MLPVNTTLGDGAISLPRRIPTSLRWRMLWARWLILPISLWQMTFYLIPFTVLFLTSFWIMKDYRLTTTWTLQNYQVFFTDVIYYKPLFVSLWFTTTTVLITIAVAYPLAYGLAFLIPRRLRVIALVAIIAPFWTNYLVRAYAWQTILANNGLLNYLLLRLQIITEPLNVLYTLVAARIGMVHFLLAITTLVLYSALEGIDRNLLEAADDLGAGRFRSFVEVVLPLSSGGLVAGAMFSFVIAFADFVSPSVLGGQSQRLFPQVIVDAVQWTVNWPRASAFATIMVLTILTVVGLFARWMRFVGIGGAMES